MSRAFLLVCVVLFAFSVWAVPEPPSNLNASFVPGENTVLVSWEHPGAGSVSFRVFRGGSPADAVVIATVSELSFLDRSVLENRNYAYYVVAFDDSGEARSLEWIAIETLAEAPFSISVLGPSQEGFAAGETVEFVVGVESEHSSELEGLWVVLINEEFGVHEVFSFDSARNAFVLSVVLPSTEKFEGLSTTYVIKATASFRGEQFSVVKPVSLLVSPVREIDVFQLALNIFNFVGLPFLLLMVASTVAFVGWKWAMQRKSSREGLWLERLEVEKERILWKHEVFKRKISEQQFREKEGELQAKLAAVDEKLGLRHPGEKPVNPFLGFSPSEADEVMRLVRAIGRPKKGETEDSLRARLVGLRRSEKVAKKVAELVFSRH